jgi:hypothetical protein
MGSAERIQVTAEAQSALRDIFISIYFFLCVLCASAVKNTGAGRLCFKYLL